MPPKKETLNYYEQKVDDLIIYIQNNLDKDLNVKTLAEKSNISFFHFHRIVKACLGMPLGTYVNNIRLDTAARIIKYTNENLSDIAIKVGYNDLSAFSKSFIREFGISPSDYRQNKESIISSHINFLFKTDSIVKFDITPKIKIIPDRKVAYIQIRGRYGGKECDEAWNILLDYARTNKIISWNPEAFSIYYDDPEVEGIDNCLFDSCIAIKRITPETDKVKTKQIEGGKYLSFRYKGPYENLWDVYNLIFQEIISHNIYKVKDMPIIENYIKYSVKTKPEKLITEICIPVE